MRRNLITKSLTVSLLSASLLLNGCPPKVNPESKPHFDPGEGAISGEVINKDQDPFDLELAGGANSLQIELLSPAQGVAASTHPFDKKAHFVFSHIAPGRYELTVFVVVPGKRSIAGNMPVTVDAGKIAPAKLMLSVTDTSNPNP